MKKKTLQTSIFSNILERNNDSDGVVIFFVLKVPDYKSAMLIYQPVYILYYVTVHNKTVLVSKNQF